MNTKLNQQTGEGKMPRVITKTEYDAHTIAPLDGGFDVEREFNSIDEAVDYCNSQPRPESAFLAIVHYRLAIQDYGFAGDLAHEGEQISQVD